MINGEADCHNSCEDTAILYTSIDWKPAHHGGCLRYWPDGNDGGNEDSPPLYEEVAPRAGTLVIFRSKTLLLHEVLPSYARRIALSLWLLSPSPSSTR